LFLFAATWAVITPFLMNTAGWFLTESGRQPWIVQGIMLTKNGISPSTTFTYLVISVVIFIALYVCLAALFLVFMLRYSRREPDPDPSLAGPAGEPDTRVPSMLY
jgi:cytochrome d ubiquinol oxidase subunit I